MTIKEADTEQKRIGEMSVKISVDANDLHASFDAIEGRIKVLLEKLEELRITAEGVGIKVETGVVLTQG